MQDTNVLIQEIEAIARRVCEEVLGEVRPVTGASEGVNTEAQELQKRIALIKAKEFLTIKEAALLLSCSESHLRKLIMLARKGKSLRPIPFVDTEGVTVFPLGSLTDWASPKSRFQTTQNEHAIQTKVD